MPKFSQIGAPIPVSIRLPSGDTLTVGYNLAALSLLQMQRVHETVSAAEEAKDTTRRADLLANELVPVLSTWDFTEDDDSLTPLTYETIRAQGDAVLCDLWRAIEDDAVPKLAQLGRWNSGSATAEASDSSLPTGGAST